MVIYVSGGASSGKSSFAESLIVNSQIQKRTYIATMRVWDDEGRERVLRHREARAGKGFDTVECAQYLEKLDLSGAVLLEDLTNLYMNEFFSSDSASAIERIKSALDKLAHRCELLVIVGNDIFSDGVDYGEEMRSYLSGLGELCRYAAGLAQTRYEVVSSVPIAHEVMKMNKTEGMTLIIGGAYQGKLSYAKGIFGPGIAYCPKDAENADVFANLELWLKEVDEPWPELEELLSVNPDIAIICDEVGCGVVPLDASERKWRERVGRVCSRLAENADSVILVWCGIPVLIKEKEI